MTHTSAFVWFELMTDDVAKAKQFYQELLGWELEDVDGYVMVKASAIPELGAGMTANPAKGDHPSHWIPYISVEDIVASVARAQELGGRVLKEVHEKPHGLVSAIMDPTGTPFYLWQAKVAV